MSEAAPALRAVRTKLAALEQAGMKPSMRQRDQMAWSLHSAGMPMEVIAFELGVSVRSVRSSLDRVENGRWGGMP